MVDLTLLEIHLPDAQFNAPFAGEGGTDEPGSTDAEPDETGSGGGGVLAVLLVAAGLAALAWFLRKRGDDDGGAEVELEAETAP